MSISIPVSFKAYLASRFSRRMEMRDIAADLVAAGHAVTSRWIEEESEDPAIAAQNAQRDIDDILKCDCLIAFLDPPRTTLSRMGHAHEMGFAHAAGKSVIIIGHRTNVFTFLPEFTFFPDWPTALAALQPSLKIAA
jgi:nucleoside 2-deoxyribosyltransferase